MSIVATFTAAEPVAHRMGAAAVKQEHAGAPSFATAADAFREELGAFLGTQVVFRTGGFAPDFQGVTARVVGSLDGEDVTLGRVDFVENSTGTEAA